MSTVDATAGTRSPRGRRARRATGDERERAILETAESLLAERSLHEISVDDLASGAGISRPTFYFYFSSKEAVLLALLDRVVEEARAARDSALDRPDEDQLERLRQGIRGTFETFRAHRAVMMAGADVRATSPAVREVWAERDGGLRLRRRRRSSTPSGPPVRRRPARRRAELAIALNLMNERVLHSTFAGHEPAIPEDDVVDALAAVWFGAIYGKPVPRRRVIPGRFSLSAIRGNPRSTMPRLRRADCAGAGIRRVRHGRGFRYEDEAGDRLTDEAALERIRRARDPARVEGGLDLPRSPRTHPGHGYRRRGTQAVPLPRRVASAAGPPQVRADARAGRSAAVAASQRQAPAGSKGVHARPGARGRGAHARPRLLSDRKRAVRGGERVLRPRHPAQVPCALRERRRDLRLPRQELAAPRPGDSRPAARQARPGAQAPPRRRPRAARLPRGKALGRRSLRRGQRVPEGPRRATSTPPRTSAPGTRPCSRPSWSR